MGEYFFRFPLLLGDGYDSYSKHMPCKHVNKILGKSETYLLLLTSSLLFLPCREEFIQSFFRLWLAQICSYQEEHQ